MKYNKLAKIVLVSLFAITGTRAQQANCRTSEENKVIFNKNPKAFKEWNDFNEFSKKNEQRKIEEIKNRKAGKAQAATYTIPVVFHVYGDIQSGKTVTYDKLVEVLNQVNLDFNGLNDDFNSVEPFFQPRRATLSVEFKLAKIDPNGNCTSGVVFHPVKSGYGNGGGYDDQIAADAWDNTKYVNVYIQNDLYNDGSLTNSGVAWYPNESMTAANTARIVFNGAYIYGNTNKEFAATMTHEFGHFFNLIHTFDGGCNGTDEVADTPKEDGNHSLACTPGTNCSGDKVNIENYMGYNGASGCYKMFTQGQVARMLLAMDHPARRTLWQPANITATGVNNTTGSALSASVTKFKENLTNNGSLSGNAVITLDGSKTFALSSGTLTQGTHYTVSNLPTGLTPVLTVNTNKQLTLTFTGNAANHAQSNSTDISIKFLSSAFAGGTTGLRCNGLTFTTSFRDPYGIFYVDMPDATATGANGWKYFDIEKGDDTGYGAWGFTNYHLKIETYGKKLVCQTGTRNISLLTAGTIINTSSNFTAPGAYPNQLDLRTGTYTTWDGKTGYVGFEYLIDGEKCHGWFRVRVDANGNGFTVLDYAYNTEPGAQIIAGNAAKTVVEANPKTIYETEVNDGALDTTGISIKLLTNNGTFTQSTGVISANRYSLTGLPAGITATLTAISNNELRLTFTGKASAHALNNSTQMTLTFMDALITGGVATLQNPSVTMDIEFEDPYGVFIVDLANTFTNANNNWLYINLQKGDNTEYGLWRYASGHLKLETYDKRLIGSSGTINISKLPFNSVIDGTKTFIAPGAYPDQLDLRSPNHNAWAPGSTGFAGFEYFRNGKPCYGWMQITIDANGDGYTITRYGYNTRPNGAITTPASLSNNDFENPELLAVYPNPFNNEITISSPELTGQDITFNIYNLLGQEVISKKTTNKNDVITLQLNNLKKGVYILKIKTGNGKMISKKIIKN